MTDASPGISWCAAYPQQWEYTWEYPSGKNALNDLMHKADALGQTGWEMAGCPHYPRGTDRSAIHQVRGSLSNRARRACRLWKISSIAALTCAPWRLPSCGNASTTGAASCDDRPSKPALASTHREHSSPDYSTPLFSSHTDSSPNSSAGASRAFHRRITHHRAARRNLSGRDTAGAAQLDVGGRQT